MSIVRGRLHPGAREVRADVAVIGGGAGGTMVARELARAGLSIVALEMGDDLTPDRFTQREDEMIPLLFRERGSRRTSDRAIAVLSGQGLGGSTLHNQNLCKRTPEPLLAHWAGALGVETASPDAMAPHFAAVERDLGVRPIAESQINAHNRIVRRGIERLGYRGGGLHHNRDDRCVGSGFCELGCAYDGKLNARHVLVPQAIEAGATFHTDCRVERVVHDGQRATGVRATVLDAAGRPHGSLEVDASAVVLAAGALGSPAIALASGVPDPHQQLGRGLRIHPAAVVAGRFDEPVHAWRGIPQSVECTEHLDVRPGSDRRVWLVPSFAHPIATAALMPGFGPALMDAMRSYDRLAVLAAMVHDETEGRVRRDGDRVALDYAPTGADRAQLALGIREAARVLLAAGARECTVPAQPAIRVRDESELAQITADRFAPHDATLTAVHPMGTLRMGADPRASSTDPRGAHHQLRGLWVADASLFPTSIGVPPQISVYAFARAVAAHVATAG